MIYLVKYNDKFRLASTVYGVPVSIHRAGRYDTELVLDDNSYVLKKNLVIVQEFGDEEMDEVKLKYPELMI